MQLGLGLDLHAAEQGSSCSIRPALPLHVGKNRELPVLCLHRTVHIYCGTPTVAGWPVGAFSSPAPEPEPTTVAAQLGTRCRPQPEKPALEPQKLYLHVRWHDRPVLHSRCCACTSALRPDLPRVS